MKPNILFIQCDSMDGRVFGAMNHPAMKRATPNIDALVENGLFFTDAYTNNPICCPSRASMFSGQYTHINEGWNNFKGLEMGTPTFMTVLENAGYSITTYGKTDYISGTHTLRARVSAWTRSANILRPQYIDPPPVILDKRHKRIHTSDWDNIGKGIDFINNAAQDDTPFFLYIGIEAPHHPFKTSQYYLDMIDEEGVLIPPKDTDIHPVMAYHKAVNNNVHGKDDESVKLIRLIYYAMIAEVDAMVGSLVDAVAQNDLSDNTYIVFTGDHGEMAMEHGEFGKMNLYEPAVRVPLIINGPKVTKQVYDAHPVSLIDIYPSIMSMAGTTGNTLINGQSLFDIASGIGKRNWVFTEYHDSGMNTGCYMLRCGDWKYMRYVGYEPQLFNIASDIWEMNNLAKEEVKICVEMDNLLCNILDPEAFDAKVKAHDKESFRLFREEQLQAGTYYNNMSLIFSGFDGIKLFEASPWTEEDEKKIVKWLEPNH